LIEDEVEIASETGSTRVADFDFGRATGSFACSAPFSSIEAVGAVAVAFIF
jgi:hypothetical protein